ncbi:MAG: MotA/TolQ/ExbB proton channel family protein [Bacteroidetes bacterium]|nr:MAG: MotA/TolQ/ExbB proton channel family protein [Bacteroidota bacterium]
MRKLLALMLVFGLAVFQVNYAYAQDENQPEQTEAAADEAQAADTTAAAAPAEEEAAQPAAPAAEEAADEPTGFQVLKEKFIEGDWRFMSLVLLCLILGLAFCIERIITLNIATTNTDKLLARIDERLKEGDLQGAMEVCKATPGPTAAILYEGLKHVEKGPDAVEKAIVSYGSVQMGLLEKGLVWISLFIAIAPMLGFMGTVIGMIQAFDRIEAVGDLSPSVVAGGIKVALLTTVFGLIVAIILQIFYNYIVSKIDGITQKMEEASIALIDILIDNGMFKK